MKKNNKGFTLIELLATVVILAIIAVLVVPLIMNLLSNSRNKIYVTDAQKLIAKAEYKMKGASSEIEKPDPGDCIVISLLYLDGEEFDNPPNGGKYLKEKSFVVVKNTGSKMQYSTMLVEQTKKGGYTGVKLTTYDNLLLKNATTNVKSFKSSEVKNVETDVTKSFINSNLGSGYIGDSNSVSAIYNYPDLDDSSAQTNISSPKITKFTLGSTSTSGYNINTLDTLLTLKVEDKDTPRASLKVYLSLGDYSTSASNLLDYKGEEVYTKNIDLKAAGYNYEDGATVKVCLTVVDPEGNKAQKIINYTIHKNVAPEILSGTTVTKRPHDKVNMPTALVKLDVVDDVDELKDLKVCLAKSSTNSPTGCSLYKNFKEYFDEENQMEFDFCDGTSCARDGSTHYLTIFVQDSMDAISSAQYTYTFSNNSAPVIDSYSVTSRSESFTTTGSKNILVKVTAHDDLDNQESLKVKISDGSHTDTYDYNTDGYDFTINGSYDGSAKTIKISVVDTEGKPSNEATKNYTLYKNTAPTIANGTTVVSKEVACNHEDMCPLSDGGSKKIKINLTASDDIDNDNLQVCVSQTTECTNYVNYVEYFKDKDYIFDYSGTYDGGTKKIYINVKDSNGSVTTKSYDYKLYKNKAPVITSFGIVSKSETFTNTGSLRALLNLDVRDDFNEAEDMKITLKENNTIKINDQKASDYVGVKDFSIGGSYDGRSITYKLTLRDNDGAISEEKTVNYTVYQNVLPTIDSFTISSKEAACNNEDMCPLNDGGSLKAQYELEVHDDVDSDSDIQVCISESSSSCTNYSSYTNYYDINSGTSIAHDYTFTGADSTKPYDGTTKKLYLYVKDSYGGISKKSSDYTLYTNKAPEVVGEPNVITNSNDNANILDATYNIKIRDDIDLDNNLQIRYCQKKGSNAEYCTNYETYTGSNVGMAKTLDKTFFGINKPNGESYQVYAKIKDSYGATLTSEKVTYKLITDQDPEIVFAEPSFEKVSADDDNSPSRQLNYKLTQRVRVNDPGDTYTMKVKVTLSYFQNNGWHDVSNEFTINTNIDNTKCLGDGDVCTAVKENIIFQNIPPVTGTGEDEKREYIKQVIVTVTDSYGNNSSSDIKTYDTNSFCTYSSEFGSKYSYVPVNENQKITTDSCAGKCYKSDSINVGYYKIIQPRDLFTNRLCEYCASLDDNDNCVFEPIKILTEYTASCDFKDCFYRNNNYIRNAIGTKIIYDDEPWTTTVNGTTYTCNGHYNLYSSSYNEGDEEITLTKTNTKICAEAIDNDYYKYSSSNVNSYIRVSD